MHKLINVTHADGIHGDYYYIIPEEKKMILQVERLEDGEVISTTDITDTEKIIEIYYSYECGLWDKFKSNLLK